MHFFILKLSSLICVTLAISSNVHAESLLPLKDGKSPQTVAAVWAGYDPTAEPLETQIIKEWEEDGVVIRAVRYCTGTFKGQKAWMAGLYAYPKSKDKLPAIVEIHGGGGQASKNACIAYAKRGYATISLSWRADERYLTEHGLPEAAQTDWGAVEGRQVNESRGIESDNEKRFDPVPSARNGGYFLRVLAARRALTFLQNQKEVDGERLGIDGHSMGGVITIETAAIDSRVKAAAPSCAPPIDLSDSLEARTYIASAYVSLLDRPILFMSPSNDFHGHVEDLEWIMDRMPNQDFHIARSEHFNHRHNASCLAAKQLWFDSILKDSYQYPSRPQIKVKLDTPDGRPVVSVTPDDCQPIDHVDVFFSRDAKLSDYNGTKSRYWQFAKPAKLSDDYAASISLVDLNEPLWVYANVHYNIDAQNLTTPSKTVTSTTRMLMFNAETLKAAGVKAYGGKTSVIEDFDSDWQKEWVVSDRSCETFRLSDSRLRIPHYGKLVIELEDEDDAQLQVAIKDYSVGDFVGNFRAKDGVIAIYPFNLVHTKLDTPLMFWDEHVYPRLELKAHRGSLPKFSKLSWIEIPEDEYLSKRPFQLGDAVENSSTVALSFDTADKIDGRTEPDASKFQANESVVKTRFERGLHVHSHSEVIYFLNRSFTSFETTIVPGYQASVTFEIHGDGKRLFDSGKVTNRSESRDIHVDVSGVRELKLVVTEGGNGWGGDWVLWANPTLSSSAHVDDAKRTPLSVPKQHLFIMSGQSNMQGLDLNLSFIPAVEAEFGKEGVTVVKDALGGQPIRRWFKAWKPAEGQASPADMKGIGTLYDRLMKKLKTETRGKQFDTVTFCWMQGEKDAKQGHGEVYAASLRGLIQQLSADLKRSDVNFVIGRLSDFALDSEKIPDWNVVRDAQVKVADASPRGAWIDTDDLNDGTNSSGRTIKNDLHYSVEGYKVLGQRFAEKAIELIKPN